jgi:hypothetical protein
MLELIKDGHGGVAMATELREVERRREALQAEVAATGVAEPVPVLHPNLPALYRRKVEALEEALKDEHMAEADQAPNGKTAVTLGGNGRSGFSREVLGSLDAGTGFEPVTFRL